MPSQFFGLNIAASGLRASNAALNTTANNIANAQTDGYSRQQVTQQAANAIRTFTTYGCAGAGVDTIAIERVRDSFYDVKYWDNNCKYGEYEVKSYYAGTIEDYFEDDGVTGFTSVFNDMSNALQSLVSNASLDTSKAEFISKAKALTDYFNNMYGNLQELQEDVNLEIKQNVDQINSIAEKIATLNKQVNVIELSGAAANELRDQREKLVDELSEIVDVQITELPIYDSNDPTRETGGTRYIVQIAGGQTLVDANDYNTLSYTARSSEEKVNQTDIDGLYQIMWSNGNEFNLTNAAMEGKLKGLVQFRDGNNGANFHGVVVDGSIGSVSVQKPDGTTVAKPTIQIKVEDDYLKNMQECTLSNTGGVINIGNTIFYYDDWSYDQGTGVYTFTMNEDKNDVSLTESLYGKDAKTEDAIKYQGIPYYMEQMNAWIRGFADKVNSIFTSGYHANSKNDTDFGCIFFTANKATEGQYTADELKANEGNGLYEITAGNFAVNDELIANASLLGTRKEFGNGPEECEKVKEMIDLLTSKEKFSFRNGSADELLESLLADVALNASNANTFCTTYKGLQTSIDNQRTSVSGVDEDEEAVSLVKYQNAYTLSSKMVQTLTEIYDQLILQTGV
ncbi:MAG: flagellar hook-associated protein FlgK [Lachnospiraceae bacterium]|nr:flagellar hook-associated protein FlgK [Lachnospiraceae bacterium]